jgi:hypothetical protein
MIWGEGREWREERRGEWGSMDILKEGGSAKNVLLI